MKIPIVSNSLSSAELLSYLSEQNTNEVIQLELEQEPTGSHMSGLDPNVVIAIITFSGVVFSSLMALLIAVYNKKSEAKKGNIEIKVGDNQLSFPSNLPPEKMKMMKSIYEEMKVSERKLRLSLPLAEDKKEAALALIEALELKEVKQITLLED